MQGKRLFGDIYKVCNVNRNFVSAVQGLLRHCTFCNGSHILAMIMIGPFNFQRLPKMIYVQQSRLLFLAFFLHPFLVLKVNELVVFTLTV